MFYPLKVKIQAFIDDNKLYDSEMDKMKLDFNMDEITFEFEMIPQESGERKVF